MSALSQALSPEVVPLAQLQLHGPEASTPEDPFSVNQLQERALRAVGFPVEELLRGSIAVEQAADDLLREVQHGIVARSTPAAVVELGEPVRGPSGMYRFPRTRRDRHSLGACQLLQRLNVLEEPGLAVMVKLLTPAYLWLRGRLVISWRDDVLHDVHLGRPMVEQGPTRSRLKLDSVTDSTVNQLERKFDPRGSIEELYWEGSQQLGVTSSGVLLLADGTPISWKLPPLFMQPASPYVATAGSPYLVTTRLLEELRAQTPELLVCMLYAILSGYYSSGSHPRLVVEDLALQLQEPPRFTGSDVVRMDRAQVERWRSPWLHAEHLARGKSWTRVESAPSS